MKYGKIFRLFALSLILTGSAVMAHAQSPESSAAPTIPAATVSASTVVKNFYDQLTEVMKQGDQLGYAGRYKKLEPLIQTTYNLPLMTRIAVGLTWSEATPEQQQELVAAFSSFSIANYASRFTHYNGEEFTVLDEKPTTGGVIVETKLKPKTTDAVALNYLMRQDDKGAWRIVDVFLDGSISELATRRAEFSSIATRDGIPALVNSLGEKSKQLGPT